VRKQRAHLSHIHDVLYRAHRHSKFDYSHLASFVDFDRRAGQEGTANWTARKSTCAAGAHTLMPTWHQQVGLGRIKANDAVVLHVLFLQRHPPWLSRSRCRWCRSRHPQRLRPRAQTFSCLPVTWSIASGCRARSFSALLTSRLSHETLAALICMLSIGWCANGL